MTFSTPLAPGFADPVRDSQSLFRACLDALANPGKVMALDCRITPPAPVSPEAAALLLALCDFETPLWLDAPEAADFFRFHCGCPIATRPDEAAFALVTEPENMPPLADFAQGSDEYPDRSTSLVLQLPALSGGEEWRLSGPGIADHRNFAPLGLPADFALRWRDNHEGFPRGIDLFLTAPATLAGLPRSTRLSQEDC